MANAIVESSYRVIGQILHTMLHGTAVRTKAELEAAFDDACAIDTCVLHCVSNISLQGNAPGTVAFGRDVNVNVPILVDIVAISVSDGSYDYPIGTAAVTIWTGKPHVFVFYIPGLPEDQSAYRSEAGGVYGQLWFWYLFTKFFQIQPTSITIGCDGESALNRIFSRNITQARLSSVRRQAWQLYSMSKQGRHRCRRKRTRGGFLPLGAVSPQFLIVSTFQAFTNISSYYEFTVRP